LAIDFSVAAILAFWARTSLSVDYDLPKEFIDSLNLRPPITFYLVVWIFLIFSKTFLEISS
jgi:hypothetical protein